MTLPYTDKPAITDTIRTIISNIKDNIDSVNSETKFKIISFTKDLSVTGTVSHTGVGFSPRTIFFFGVEPTSDTLSWGIYSLNAYGYKDKCIYLNWFAGSGNYTRYSINFYVGGGGGTHVAIADVYSRDADGFTLEWSHSVGSPTGTATIIAFCIR